MTFKTKGKVLGENWKEVGRDRGLGIFDVSGRKKRNTEEDRKSGTLHSRPLVYHFLSF